MTDANWLAGGYRQIREDLVQFRDRIYWLTASIPEGKVATYGQIALYAGSPRAARAAGNVLKGAGHMAEKLPWHRVINSKGGISCKSDVERAKIQRRRLEREGIAFVGDTCDLDVFRWEPEHIFWGENAGF